MCFVVDLPCECDIYNIYMSIVETRRAVFILFACSLVAVVLLLPRKKLWPEKCWTFCVCAWNEQAENQKETLLFFVFFCTGFGLTVWIYNLPEFAHTQTNTKSQLFLYLKILFFFRSLFLLFDSFIHTTNWKAYTIQWFACVTI